MLERMRCQIQAVLERHLPYHRRRRVSVLGRMKYRCREGMRELTVVKDGIHASDSTSPWTGCVPTALKLACKKIRQNVASDQPLPT